MSVSNIIYALLPLLIQYELTASTLKKDAACLFETLYELQPRVHVYLPFICREFAQNYSVFWEKKFGLNKCRHRHKHLRNTSRKNLDDKIVMVLRDFMNVHELVAGFANKFVWRRLLSFPWRMLIRRSFMKPAFLQRKMLRLECSKSYALTESSKL